MPKNITYHQTAAQKARRSRNDSAAVAGLGGVGLGMTPGMTGLEHPAKVGAHEFKAERRLGTGVGTALKRGAAFAGDAARHMHAGRAVSQAAIGVGAAGVVGGEARNVYHTHKEQKLRRQRIKKSAFLEDVSKMKQNKVKKTYCKQHQRFDACAEQPGNSRLSDDQYVSKAAEEVAARLERLTARRKAGFGFKTRTPQDAMPAKGTLKGMPAMKSGGGSVPTQRVAKAKDDGIHHLTGVERIRTSRVRTGGLVPLETGRRKLDGTPRTGTGEGSHKITSAVTEGVSGRSKPVGASRIREQIGKSLSPHDAFLEVSKSGYTKADRHLEQAQHGLGQAARLTVPPVVGAATGGMVGHLLAGKVGGVAGMVAGGIAGARSGVQRAEKASQVRKKRLVAVSKAHDAFLVQV